MKIESKRLSPTTRDLRDQNTGYPSAIFKRRSGSMNTTNTLIPAPPSLTTMVLSTAIMCLLGIMALLCQLSIMAILLLKSWPLVLLLVILINSAISIKAMQYLIRYTVWWWDATR